VHFYVQDEDPSYIYLLGGWDSVVEHLEAWIPSQTNQELLTALKDEIEVVWMFHVEEIDYFELLGVNLGMGKTEKQRNLVGSSEPEITRISFGRYLINERSDREIASLLGARLATITASAERTCVLAGWRIDREEDGRELILLMSGVESFESTRMENLIRRREVRSGTLLDG
jgi:hypothetical protein